MSAAVTQLSQVDPLTEAFQRLSQTVFGLPGYRPIALPSELARMEGKYGDRSVVLEASAFAARGVCHGRIVEIRGPGTHILNAIAFTEPGGTIPVLGIEVLVFRERVHLVVADLFPLRAEDDRMLEDVAADPALGDPAERSEWARSIFSSAPVFHRPKGDRGRDAHSAAASAVDVVALRWVERVRGALPVEDAVRGSLARASLASYTRAHAAGDPAIPFLTRAFGETRTSRLVDEVLFPVRLREVPS